MVFSSLSFIFIFLPIFLFIYYFTPYKLKNFILFAGSMIFYGIGVMGNPFYIILFIISIAVNYIIGVAVENNPRKKILLILGLIYNFAWLFLFKYSSFMLSGLFEVSEFVLPLGISFYTFQMVSYIIDVYRGDVKAEKSIITLGAYISMFPQLIAGPIVTYGTVRKKLHSKRRFQITNLASGLMTFIAGLGLKVLIANQLGSLWSTVCAIGFDSISTPLAWLGIFGFSFQLYFDFWGYSLMAVGLGKMLGINLPKNFDHPYTAVSMTDFWRKWHITLGSWFREYLYIPLGGNRCGKLKWVRNLFIVWLLTGFWHGAGWNFILWGLVLFVILFVEKTTYGKFLEKQRWLGHAYMILLIPLTWLIFAVTDMNQMGVYFGRLFPFIENVERTYFAGDFIKNLSEFKLPLIAAVLFSTKLPVLINRKIGNTVVGYIIYAAIFWLAIYCLYMGMNDPFLYFRF